METQIVEDNHGGKHEVYKNLKIGTKLLCKINTHNSISVNNGNSTVTFDNLIKGKVYEVTYIQKWGWGDIIPCVNNERNCVDWAKTNVFDIVK